MKATASYVPSVFFSKASSSWSSLSHILPHRLRRKFRSTRSKLRTRASPASNLATLETSFNPALTIAALRAHTWSYYDGQYLLLAVLGIFSLCMMQAPGPFTKTAVATLLLVALVTPVLRQFWFPFLPIATWLVLFYSCQFIGADYRPPIWVRVLPALENIFYGANLSNILSAHKHTYLDVLAWLPYGITHFGAPFVCSIVMFFFCPPGTVPAFARAFGYMNLAGVLIQLFFPCSPPWYENLYGLAPANYSMPGSPAGLAAIDRLFNIDLYTSTFTASPMVFGAFPSLHSGCATIEALFMSWAFPRLRPLFVCYVLWLWWATMYLSHHYAVDLVGGSLLAGVCFFVAKSNFLPRTQPDRLFRWDYDYIDRGDAPDPHDYGASSRGVYAGLNTFVHDAFRHESDVEWGSSSSVNSSGARSPSVGTLRSPVERDGGVAGEETWKAETLPGPGSGGEDAARG